VHRVVRDNRASSISLTDSDFEDQNGDCDQAHCHQVGNEPLAGISILSRAHERWAANLESVIVVNLNLLDIIVTFSDLDITYLARVSDKIAHSFKEAQRLASWSKTFA